MRLEAAQRIPSLAVAQLKVHHLTYTALSLSKTFFFATAHIHAASPLLHRQNWPAHSSDGRQGAHVKHHMQSHPDNMTSNLSH